MKLVNLGCGKRFHTSWANFDFKSNNEHVIVHNLYQKLPLEDDSVDMVYCSHVLEHFPKQFAPKFLNECLRILKPNGTVRIIVPDLEQLMRNYIKFLDQAKKGDPVAQQKYEWTLIELFDQMVRNHSGGEMLAYWKQNPMPQEEFVIERLGSEVKQVLSEVRQRKHTVIDKNTLQPDSQELGKFRLSGEPHQWMYDEHSLSQLLIQTGFEKSQRMSANESRIENFNHYLLDIEPDGSVRKPDSLFIEAIKK